MVWRRQRIKQQSMLLKLDGRGGAYNPGGSAIEGPPPRAPPGILDVRPELVGGRSSLHTAGPTPVSAPPTVMHRPENGGPTAVKSKFQWALDSGSYIRRAGWQQRPANQTRWGKLGATASTPVVMRGAIAMETVRGGAPGAAGAGAEERRLETHVEHFANI